MPTFQVPAHIIAAPILGAPRYVDPTNAVWLTIEATDAEEATLEIPQKMRSKAEKVATNSQETNRLASVPVAAGEVLTLCLASGVLLVPGRGRKVAVCAAGLATIGGLLFALRQPHATAEPPPAVIGKPIALPAGLSVGDVHVTFTESGEAIRLRLPRKKLPELAKQLKETPR